VVIDVDTRVTLAVFGGTHAKMAFDRGFTHGWMGTEGDEKIKGSYSVVKLVTEGVKEKG
jgi:hypothetical protein